MIRNALLLAVALASVAALAASCGDLGDESPGGALRASSPSVTVPPGGTATVTIQGGNPPYVVQEAPDPALASANLVNNADRTGSLRITAPTSASVGGSTSVKVKDTEADHGATDAPLHGENEIEIPITIGVASPGAPVVVPGGGL